MGSRAFGEDCCLTFLSSSLLSVWGNQILAKPGGKLGCVKRHEVKNMKASFAGQDVMAAKMFEG